MMLEGSLVTVVAIAWLFLRMAQEGEIRQELIERGHDERTVRRAVRYRRWQELGDSGPALRGGLRVGSLRGGR